jgi:hypothetical protein
MHPCANQGESLDDESVAQPQSRVCLYAGRLCPCRVVVGQNLQGNRVRKTLERQVLAALHPVQPCGFSGVRVRVRVRC